MGSPPPIALPPVTVDYANTLQPVKAGAPPTTSQYTYTRATDGKTRVDSGNLSVITNPATAQTILLDHVKKTASIQPTPPTAPPAPGMPQMPGMPKPPTAPPVEELGKRLFQGHEVQGTRFVTQPPPLPKPPAFQMPSAKLPGFQMPGAPKPPQMPGAPPVPGAPAMQIPGMPKPPALTIPGMPKPPQIPGAPPLPGAPAMPGAPPMPGAPAMPGAPPPPTTPQPPITTEVWTSTKMAVPMIAKINGGFGQITQVCKSAVPGEPHPSAFQIPAGYKMI